MSRPRPRPMLDRFPTGLPHANRRPRLPHRPLPGHRPRNRLAGCLQARPRACPGRCPRACRSGCAEQADAGRIRFRHGRHGPQRKARRRLLRICRRQLGEDHADPRGPLVLERLQRAQRHRAGAHPRHHRGCRRRQAQRRGCTQGRRLLPRLHGRAWHRGQGHRAAEGRPRRDRRRGRQGRALARPRRHAARGRGRAELDQLLHQQPVRRVDHPALRPPDRDRGLPAAGWPGHAGPRLLPGRRPHGRHAQGLPGARGEDALARGHRRRGRQGGAHPRTRDRDRESTRHAGRDQRRQDRHQPVEAHGVRDQGPGHRLGCLLRRRQPGHAGGTHRLAAESHRRHFKTRRQPADRHLEGLPAVPRD